jgi:hypothetical protein
VPVEISAGGSSTAINVVNGTDPVVLGASLVDASAVGDAGVMQFFVQVTASLGSAPDAAPVPDVPVTFAVGYPPPSSSSPSPALLPSSATTNASGVAYTTVVLKQGFGLCEISATGAGTTQLVPISN